MNYTLEKEREKHKYKEWKLYYNSYLYKYTHIFAKYM